MRRKHFILMQSFFYACKLRVESVRLLEMRFEARTLSAEQIEKHKRVDWVQNVVLTDFIFILMSTNARM